MFSLRPFTFRLDLHTLPSHFTVKIFTDSLCLIFFLILFYVSYEITYEAFIKNYNTGTVWGPPLWIPYSSMLIGATLMTMSYISELILHVRKLKEFK